MSPAGRQVHFKAMRKLAAEHPSEKVGEEIRKLYSWNGEDKLINQLSKKESRKALFFALLLNSARNLEGSMCKRAARFPFLLKVLFDNPHNCVIIVLKHIFYQQISAFSASL